MIKGRTRPSDRTGREDRDNFADCFKSDDSAVDNEEWPGGLPGFGQSRLKATVENREGWGARSMAMRNDSARNRAARPVAEDLEGRQLLSGTVSGTDIDGDTWTIRLIGPGAIRVNKQPDASGNPAPLNSASLIDLIEVAGTNPLETKVVGTVKKGPNGDGKVFFSNFTELANRSKSTVASTTGFSQNAIELALVNNNKPITGSGILSVDLPNFWLGDTLPLTTSSAGTPKAVITIPDGVNSLRFGGADTTAFFGTTNNQRLDQNGISDRFDIKLGLPTFGSTRIVVDSMITSGQASTSGSTGAPTQDSIDVIVDGRLDLFQANSIQGNTNFPSSQFAGGTSVRSESDSTGITGAIGNVRVGGNATNFSVSTNDRIANFFIGGETNNIFLLTPAGSRNISFGKGMDNVTINTAGIQFLSANRGAIGSNVTSSTTIGRVEIGGDVVNTNIQTGYIQGLATAFATLSPPTTITAQNNGTMQVHVAGDITNSVFAASVQPDIQGVFGTSNDLLLPHGSITAKVEGKIDNSTATPDAPTKAFYSQQVKFSSGPVIPPNIPEAPYTRRPLILPGLALGGLGGRYKAPIPTRHKNIRPYSNSPTPNTASSVNPVVTAPVPKVTITKKK